MARRCGTWRIGRGGRRPALQNRRARLQELLLDAKRELLHGGQASESRELRRQFEILRNEALILSVEEETDLAERLEILFVAQRDHVSRI